MGRLYFDEVDCFEQFGIEVSSGGTYNAPDRDVEKISIPGRNGDLILDNERFNNIQIEYPASIVRDLKKNSAAANLFFSARADGYYRLYDDYHDGDYSDDYHGDYYRMARSTGGIQYSPVALNRGANFTLRFDAKPQKFLISGDTEYKIETGIGLPLINPTSFQSDPIIKLSNMKAVTVILFESDNLSTQIIVEPQEHILIDCELGVIHNGLRDLSHAATMQEHPKLDIGGTFIKCWKRGADGSDEYPADYEEIDWADITITPRWWTI